MKKISTPSKDSIINYYIIQEHTKDETCNYFGVSPTTLSRWFKFYDIKKTQEEMDCTKTKKYEDPESKKQANLKREQTCLKKYGVINVAQNESVQQKTKQTCLNKYGCSCVLLNKEIKSKIKQSCFNKYGSENPFGSLSIQQKIKETNLKKYGHDYATQSKVVKDKTRNTNLNKYGVEYITQHLYECSEESIEVLKTKENLVNFISGKPKMTISELAEEIGCHYIRVQRAIKEFELQDYIDFTRGYSQQEEDLRNFLLTITSEEPMYNNRDILPDNKELDIYYNNSKIAIEYNGTHWHSIDKIKDKRYHYNKSKSAQDAGIHLIHIYEYEWLDPVKRSILESILKISFNKVDSKIYARECEIREISNKEAKPFNDKNHLQGHRNAQITYGLFYKEKLVQLMSFSKTKYNKNLKNEKSWEIIRGCPGSNNIVIGGVSKLFKHFIKQNNPEEIFSYCDFNKFNGKGYESIGMKLIGYTGPDMKWVLPNNEVVERKPSKHKELKEQARTQIFGSGSKKYLWKKN